MGAVPGKPVGKKIPPRLPLVFETERGIRADLEERARFVRSGSHARADLKIGDMLKRRASLGLVNVPVATVAIVHDAHESTTNNNPERAIQLLDKAVELSPEWSDVHWLRLSSAFSYRAIDVLRFVGILSDFVVSRMSGFRNHLTLILDLLIVCGLALIFMIVVFALIQSVKYVRYAAHDIVELLPSSMSKTQAYILLILFWVAPLAFGLGITVAAAFWLTTVLAYQDKWERVVSLAAYGVAAAVPVVIYGFSPLVAFHGSVADSLISVTHEAFANEAEEHLVEYVSGEGSKDYAVVMALANRSRIRGDLAGAKNWYERALQIKSNSVAARNNLGHTAFLANDLTTAMKHFRRAGQSETAAEPWLNVASVLIEDSKFDAARSSIERARTIDGVKTNAYGNVPMSTPTQNKLLLMDGGDLDLWGRVFASASPEEKLAITTQFWRALGGRLAPMVSPILVLALTCVGMFMVSSRQRFGLSVACPKCGRSASASAPKGLCAQCQSLFLHTAIVDPTTRAKKEQEILRFHSRRRWFKRVASVIPGAPEVYEHRPILGVADLFAFGFCVVAVLSMPWFSKVSGHVWTGVSVIQPMFFVLVAGLLVLLSVRRAFR